MGLDIERFIDDVEEELICPICNGVLEDPVQAPDCEHAFCHTCIRLRVLLHQKPCPVDQRPVTYSQLRPVPRLIRNLISRLRTCCDNAAHGCKAILTLDSLASHLVECEFNPERPVRCEAGCGVRKPKGELAEHSCVRELRELIATHQIKLNDYEHNLAELKRVHQEKLNDYKQELAELKRELAELKESKDEMRPLKRSARRGPQTPYLLPENVRVPTAGPSNPSTRALAEQREREEVVRWSNTLSRVTVTCWYANLPTPGNDLKMSIKRSLSESGCPRHILDDLVTNCEFGRWPPCLRFSYGTLSDSVYDKYRCKRVPGHQAVVVLQCDNTHVNQQQMMVKPGFIVIFPNGIE